MSVLHSPSEELQHFTDRDDEQKLFREVLKTPASGSLPTLNFHGVGGIGKTWLRRRLEEIRRQEFSATPSALLDYDGRTLSGPRYVTDPSQAWFEIAKQLRIPCPRFLLAFYILRAKQTDTPIAAKGLSHGEASKMDVAGQLATELLTGDWVTAAFGGVPFVGLIPFAARKGVEKLAEDRFQRMPDVQQLEAMEPGQIYKDLLPRLIQDLNEHQPKQPANPPRQCHSVVFLDTFEALGDNDNTALHSEREAWVRQFARQTKHTLVVVLGQNRLTWDLKPRETFWNQPQNLETHRVGELSEQDARLYLARCEIADPALQDAVLQDSACLPEPGFHPWTLGLCAETLWAMRDENGAFPSAQEFFFEDGEHGPAAVVDRFLRTQTDTRRRWIERLAVTLRFRAEDARHACRTSHDESHAAWERLRGLSFVEHKPGSAWSVLHSHMRNQILAVLSDERKQEEHEFWREWWQSRRTTDTDEYAGLAWYHRWHLDPEVALDVWNALAEGLREKAAMQEHFRILNWPAPLRAEPDSGGKEQHSYMLNSYGIQLYQASLGDRARNLHDAIACYDAALKIKKREQFPQEWAITQNNKGAALSDLPDGDRSANLRAAIACYDLALEEQTREQFPQDWAMTQNNKGNALAELPDDDRTANLHGAIACYDAALKVFTREQFPQDWAKIQNNKGNALSNLPGGDRRKNLYGAIVCYDAALEVRKREKFPQDWAVTQNNKGTALSNLPDGDPQNQHNAIACYDLALLEYTREAFPQKWAIMQYNKGNALADLPDGDRSANLRAAIACYDLALEVRTREQFPQQWAMTHFNKCVALAMLQEWGRALQEAELAIEGYRQVGHSFDLQDAERLKQQILDDMQKDSEPPTAE